MKKTFKLLAIAFAAMSMGTVMTSCSEDGSGGFLSRLFGLFSGETYYYTGTLTSQALDGSSNGDGWSGSYINATQSNTTGTNSYSAKQITLKSTSSAATLTIPAYTDGNISVSEISISNLTQTTNEAQTLTTLDIDTESTRIDGTLSFNGATYTIGYVYITKADATTTSLDLEMTLYFYGDNDKDGSGNVLDYSKAINFTYKGVGQTE